MPNGFTLLINAGGESLRMGQLKALLPTPDGTPLIRRVAARLLPLAQTCIVIANDLAICAAVAPLTNLCIPDAYANSGPLGGLATGMEQLDGWAICVACDMPLVNPDLFRLLITLALETDAHDDPRWDAVVPQVDGRPQPLHALYHRRCLPAIMERLSAGQRRMDSFLTDVRVRRVAEDEVIPLDPGLRSFSNINTPEEWQAYEKVIRDS